MKKLNKNDVLFFVSLGISLIALIVFSLPDVQFSPDKTLNSLITATVPRLAVCIFLIIAMFPTEYSRSLALPLKGLLFSLVWSIPCFLVATVNFPFSALIQGSATIDRMELLWLFILKCISIGLMEELFFRGIVLPIFLKKLKNNKYGIFFSVLLSSLLFSLMHLMNLFMGGSFGATFLQIGYTFLIGCMFAITFLKTENLWLCTLIHVLFNIGGLIVTDLGHGAFQDTIFWILTVVAGVICMVHMLIGLKSIINRKANNRIK